MEIRNVLGLTSTIHLRLKIENLRSKAETCKCLECLHTGDKELQMHHTFEMKTCSSNFQFSDAIYCNVPYKTKTKTCHFKATQI
jgi:hypothetical protein